MSGVLQQVLFEHDLDSRTGMTAVCSAHPLVLEAAVLQEVQDGGPVPVEATCNQVDQFVGYTGLRPADFRDLVHRIADRRDRSRERVVLGGDHLGPNTWRELPAEQAMANAAGLVGAYVAAGYPKIHLDCSMPCADDPGPPDDAVVAGRAAQLAGVGDRAAEQTGISQPLYVIGTEVPVPGGAGEHIDALTPTTPVAARTTLAVHREAFELGRVGAAWERVVALVVQPGVEFDHTRVVDYDPHRTEELVGEQQRSDLPAVLERRMLAQPR